MKWKKYNKISGLHVCPQMDMYLTSCGFTKASAYYLTHPCEMHDKYLLHDLREVVHAIGEFIKNNKKIVIIGDYDADGVTSTSCLYLTLDYCGACVEYLIPHRVKNGYGLSHALVDDAIAINADVILTCDNGISALEAIRYAKSKGIIVIVTDHHTPGETLPIADYIVHPALGDYPFSNISGCQTAYKLCLGIIEECSPLKDKKLIKKAMRRKEFQLKDYLFQLSAISIVTDVMPLASIDEDTAKVNENRKWLMDGIEMIKKNPDWRIQMMLKELGVNQKTFEETSIGFYVGPCLNAVGRLTDAGKAVQFLTAQTKEEAKKRFSFMYYINEERKKVKLECLEKIHMSDKHKINLIVQKELHEGVLGILASHYTNQNGYPTFVLTDCTIESGQKAWKGSGRGVEELNLYDILSQVQDETGTLYTFGGHAGAVGVTVLDENIEQFKSKITEIVEDRLAHSSYAKNYIQLTTIEQRKEIAEAVKELKPFGNGLRLPIVELSYNVKEINLYYKSKHAKFLHKEPDKSGTKTIWNNFELWNYGGLEEAKILCNRDFVLSFDNVQKLINNGKTESEAQQQKYEKYIRKTKESRVTYKVEVGYSDFCGMGPRFNVLEVTF
ncbi:single-stranded-DNA-specific exonuclease RecJ [Coprobacillus cateniformis]|jgi:single-stranded-DNA-specific exonuclease|nr:DHH family phosphoesterase [Coprobacillus cateniformis]RGO14201.1 hypothetical protein DXB30_12545 [Coprobacillus cateniformis]RGO23222.1 hypothetical protein DXB26_12615 [Coprobacillus cateniformis]